MKEFSVVWVKGNWVQLRIRCSSSVYLAVFKSAVVLPQFRMAYNLGLRVNDHSRSSVPIPANFPQADFWGVIGSHCNK
jgi:hypothetical protein